MKTLGRRLIQLAILAGVVGAAGASWSAINRYRQRQAASGLPEAPARKTDFLAIIRCRGELKAARSASIYAPLVPNLRIAWLAPAGEMVQVGMPIIRFDPSSAQQQLVQKEAQLAQAQATLDQALAQARITAQKDQTDLADARFNVERARLATTSNEIVSRLQAEQTRIDLGVAEQKLRAQEATVALHEASDAARIASVTRQRDQARAEVELNKARLGQMEIRAPLTGYAMMNSNYNQGPLNAKPFKVGDNVFSGMNLAEMPDLATLEMDAKVEEIDRGRVGVGNAARLRVDALPELAIDAEITQISPMAELGIEYPPTRSFRAYARLARPDPRLRTGMNGSMDIIVNRLPGAISIPAKALFTRAGKPVVFASSGGRYSAVEVKVLARNPDEVAISGVAAGTMVALADPEKPEKSE